MEDFSQLQLFSKKNIESVDIDMFTKLRLTNKGFANMYESDIRSVISETEVFQQERNLSTRYRLYGSIDYMSLLNGLKLDYKWLKDYFDDTLYNKHDLTKNLLNSFDVYVVKPTSESYGLIGGSSSPMRIRRFEVVSTPSDIEIFPVGFAKNIYGNSEYCFIVSNVIDVGEEVDNLGFPITELFLYLQYKPTSSTATGGSELVENLLVYSYETNLYSEITPQQYNVGDIIDGDLVTPNYRNFELYVIENCKYKVISRYLTTGLDVRELHWVYNPFQKIVLSYYSTTVNRVNKNTAVQEDLDRVPLYAYNNDNRNTYVWRDILEQGITDPISGDGTDHPFVNNTHYVFTTNTIDMIPHLEHDNTRIVFNTITFNTRSAGVQPTDDITDINPSC